MYKNETPFAKELLDRAYEKSEESFENWLDLIGVLCDYLGYKEEEENKQTENE